MRHAGRPCLNSMKSLPDETNVNYAFSTSAAGRGDFSTLSSRSGRGFQFSDLICLSRMLNTPNVNLKRWSRDKPRSRKAPSRYRHPMKAKTR